MSPAGARRRCVSEHRVPRQRRPPSCAPGHPSLGWRACPCQRHAAERRCVTPPANVKLVCALVCKIRPVPFENFTALVTVFVPPVSDTAFTVPATVSVVSVTFPVKLAVPGDVLNQRAGCPQADTGSGRIRTRHRARLERQAEAARPIANRAQRDIARRWLVRISVQDRVARQRRRPQRQARIVATGNLRRAAFTTSADARRSSAPR